MVDRWEKEKEALRKIQMHFSFQRDRDRAIKYEAADLNINPSDCMRKIVGLDYKKIQRPRIGLSFTVSDLEYLAKRYHLSLADDSEIKRRVQEEVNMYYDNKKGE